MSLTGTNYLARARTGIGQESYIVEFTNSASVQDLVLATQDYDIPGYHGHAAILSAPSIREEIDLLKCTASVGNVTIECANIMIGGALASPPRLLSSILKNGNHAGSQYVTFPVTIKSWLGPAAPDANNTLTIFVGRLVQVAPSSNGTLRLELEVKRPWDLISIPNVKTPKGNYFPVVYGDYTPNTCDPASMAGNDAYCPSTALWPARVETWTNEMLICPMPQAYSTDAVRGHIYESSVDRLAPLVDSAGDYLAATTTLGDGHAAHIDALLTHGIAYKPTGLATTSTWPMTFTDPENAFDVVNADDTVTYATATVTTSAKEFYMQCPHVELDVYDTNASHVEFHIFTRLYFSRFGAPHPQLWLSIDGGTSFIASYQPTAVGDVTVDWTIDHDDLPGGVVPQQIGFYFFISGGSTSCECRVRDVRFEVISRTGVLIDEPTATDEDKAVAAKRGQQQQQSVKQIYFGCDGLGATGGFQASVADQIHEIHRDMLYRFAGVTATPDGWSATDSARQYWDARLWLHEPVELIKVLEQLQYEGGFVYHIRPNGTGNYITVKTIYSAGDVAATLDCQQDVRGLTVSHTHAKDLVTKYEVDFRRHPADESRYLEHDTATSSSRADYDFGTTENIKAEALDFLVTTASDNSATVSAWTDYRELMAGSVKTQVACTVLNRRYWFLEVGDIVMLANPRQHQDPFGNITTAYYMVTKTVRRPGEMDLALREVG